MFKGLSAMILPADRRPLAMQQRHGIPARFFGQFV